MGDIILCGITKTNYSNNKDGWNLIITEYKR